MEHEAVHSLRAVDDRLLLGTSTGFRVLRNMQAEYSEEVWGGVVLLDVYWNSQVLFLVKFANRK